MISPRRELVRETKQVAPCQGERVGVGLGLGLGLGLG